MAKILVLYDKWMHENAEEMWRTAFKEAGIDAHARSPSLSCTSSKHLYEVVYMENVPGSYKWSSEVVDNVKEANGNPVYIKENIIGSVAVVSGYAPFTSEIMDASEDLEIIGISRGGPVNADHDAATKRGIRVLRAVGRNAESVADQTMGFVISESRLIARHSHEVKTGEYFKKLESEGRSSYMGSFNWMELNGKTLGLIGYGQVGARVAKRAHAFGMNVIVYDPYIDALILESEGCANVKLDSLLRDSDFISIHAKLTPETRYMINEETLAMMKKTTVIINTARGEIIDEEALYRALTNGVIASAALDVFEVDPIRQDNPLIGLDNVTITPHSAGRSPDTEMRGYRQVALQVTAFLRGEEINPMYVSNKAVL